MRKKLFLIILLSVLTLMAKAQNDMLTAYRNAIPGGYQFWVYAPEEYCIEPEPIPMVVFLHGASLRGRDLEKVRKYGPLQAINMGRPIPALILAPQNPSGSWDPKKIDDVVEWTKAHYQVDASRIYVLGMSLGGYGTLDYAGTYPHKVAAAMALCGGCTLRDKQGLGDLPLWIIHGTADKAVGIQQSKTVVEALQKTHHDERLRYDWLPGANHGVLARIFYLDKTYLWLFSHSLDDEGRPVNREYTISKDDLPDAYGDIQRRDDKLYIESK